MGTERDSYCEGTRGGDRETLIVKEHQVGTDRDSYCEVTPGGGFMGSDHTNLVLKGKSRCKVQQLLLCSLRKSLQAGLCLLEATELADVHLHLHLTRG